MLNPAYTTSSSRAGSRALGSRVVVLTGASSGIGRATALALAEQGATVVLAARDRAALEAVAAECERRGGEALAVPTDVVDAAAVRALADAAISRFGSIDVWINNAGVGVVGRFDEIPIAVHRRVVETNLLGEMNGAHAAVQHFRQQQRGTLINMVSIGAWAPTPYAVAYTASKFGLRGFSEALRAELRDLPDVHVCEVYPTFVDTPGFQNGGNYTGRRLKPPPPLLDPQQVARAVVGLVKRPRDALSIGSVAWPSRLAHALAPGLLGRATKRLFDTALQRADAAPSTSGNLFDPSRRHAVDGGYRAASPLPAATAPVAGGAVALALAALAYALWRGRSR
ncbi:SDR family oxidoreductase [Aquincola tertiaricarbonis]|uniref:SDR family oxidoreductase n=1 Tax=Aquincola tertiaricarbonis TaxID=391953 RepID=UPI000614EC81|nr:SDR family oxidoreductase [Aquincola tertiaricarbonis]